MRIDRRQFLKTGGAGALAAGLFSAKDLQADTSSGFKVVPGESDAALFARARDRFLFPSDVTYCNTGTLGACPADVMNVYVDGLQSLEEELPDWPYFQADGEPLTGYQRLEDVRRRVGAFVNADFSEIAITQNATMGMSFIANGMELQPGDEVITTDQEHSGGVGSWRLRAARDGIVVKELPLDSALDDGPDAVVELYEDAITAKTKVLMCSHITSLFGIVMPAQELCALAKRYGIMSVVDGAQAIGQIPVDVKALGCDAFVASPHKWVMAPKGTGFMYLRNDLPQRIWSTLAGGHFDDWESGAFRFMQFGTGSVPIVQGMVAAFNFVDEIGVERISAWDFALNRRLREGLESIPGVFISSPTQPEFAAGITSFGVQGVSSRDLQNAFWEDKIRVRAQREDVGVRFCCHLYVNPDDVDRALSVVERVA
ncbi:MAG: aminotransferase class V-fold PLP-dependent enzyme [Congregibacter sp.]